MGTNQLRAKVGLPPVDGKTRGFQAPVSAPAPLQEGSANAPYVNATTAPNPQTSHLPSYMRARERQQNKKDVEERLKGLKRSA